MVRCEGLRISHSAQPMRYNQDIFGSPCCDRADPTKAIRIAVTSRHIEDGHIKYFPNPSYSGLPRTPFHEPYVMCSSLPPPADTHAPVRRTPKSSTEHTNPPVSICEGAGGFDEGIGNGQCDITKQAGYSSSIFYDNNIAVSLSAT